MTLSREPCVIERVTRSREPDPFGGEAELGETIHRYYKERAGPRMARQQRWRRWLRLSKRKRRWRRALLRGKTLRRLK